MNTITKKVFYIYSILCLILASGVSAQDVTISVYANQDKKAVSPNLYGRNNSFDKSVQFYNDAGLRFARMNGGNNATKYNWRKKISSHPDWYNNVYKNNWDETSEYIAKNYPEMQVMWAFQLIGRVASSTEYNFNDWEYNSSQWWQGVGQNLAGDGVPNEDNPGGKALVEGDIDLYTEVWPADSTVAILDHWFGEDGIGLDKNQFLYWNMDNEADVWNGTHDDVMSDGLLPASEFMDNFIEVAKKAKAKFPEIKICGPVTTSEWQWYKWGEESIWINGEYYCWLEYFIKRLADEESATGIRLIDVIDLHNYPYAPTNADALQNHRMYYDKTYTYPGANGVKTINGGWDNSQTKEYIFQRIEDWLTEYFGENHGITLGLSEWSPGPDEPNLANVIYASHLGTFANHGVEYLTPWNWFTGMWETLHLFSRYAQEFNVKSTSTDENMVSAYTTVNESADSMTVIIVNRNQNSQKEVEVQLNDFTLSDGWYKVLKLGSLPSTETFKSHSNNALVESAVMVNSNSFTLNVPALSVSTVILSTNGSVKINENIIAKNKINIYPNPANEKISIRLNAEVPGEIAICVYDQSGRIIRTQYQFYDGITPILTDTSELQAGYYVISVKSSANFAVTNFAVVK
ncbi:MAG: T9SS type A sorting domain-containing protein [Bacteroidales bacterium]|nr:T9SS type A sorting domain-containing protein [Bacteroidales bacterium]MBN2820929.1 T9SS type A sorting domain-containing protein [Bacteroidales bacterium]